MNSSTSHSTANKTAPLAKSLVALLAHSGLSRSSCNWLIVITGAIANGFILLHPILNAHSPSQTTTHTVLPHFSNSSQAHYRLEVEKYNKLLQTAHTQQEHLKIADALANMGCREAATKEYEMVMAHDSQPHTHAPVNVCNPEVLPLR